MAALQDAYIADQEMIAGRGLHRLRSGRADRRAPVRRGRRTPTSPGCSSSCTSRSTTSDVQPELTVIYTPNLEADGLPVRPPDRRRPRARRHARVRVRLLRRVEEGRAPHVEPPGLRAGRAAAARGVQGHPDAARRPRRPDRRPLGHRQDDDDLHAPERLAAGAGRLRRLAARRPRAGDRGRLLRQDLRALDRGRADHPRRRDAPRGVPRERVAGRRAARSTSSTRATRRTAARRSRSRSSSTPTRASSSRRTSC